MSAKVKCPGSGLEPVAGTGDSWAYPFCPLCGKEFSTNSRRTNAKWGNIWIRGCPPHFTQRAIDSDA